MSVWPGRLARAGSGLLVLGAVAAVGAAAWLAPVPDDVVVEGAVLPVPPGPTTLVCPGPVTLPTSVDGVDPEFNPAPVSSVDAARFAVGGEPSAQPLDVWALDALGEPPVLSVTGLTADTGIGVSQPGLAGAVVARAHATDGVVPRIAGAVSSSVQAGDMRGIAAASCQHPASEVWLLGGGTQLGSTSLLSVHNPGATPAEIRLDMWGPAGPIELGGAARYIVPSGGELSLRLSAFAAEQARTVVRVTSAGGQIAAFLQVSELDGFVAAGMDVVVPNAPPSERQVVGTLVVPTSEVGGPGAAQLRLLAPGESATDATGNATSAPAAAADEAASGETAAPERMLASITFLGPEGPMTLPGAESVELVTGEVFDVDLGGLPAGAYAVVVDAERPVLAAARTERVGTPAQGGEQAPVEIAWTAATVTDGDALVAIPAGVSTSLVVAGVPAVDADGDAGVVTARMRVFDDTGAEILVEQLEVAAGRSLDVPLPQGAAAVDVTPLGADLAVTGGATLEWGVLAASNGPDGTFLSTLTVPVRGAVVGEVAVRQAQRLPFD